MSILTYNGISLPYCFTTQFSQEAVWDESMTDRYLTKFEIEVQATLNYNFLTNMLGFVFNPGNAVVQDPATIMTMVRQTLMKERQTLSFIVNGTELIPLTQQTGNTPLTAINRGDSVDAYNGPKPQYCHIIDMGEETLLISYKIVAHYWENSSFNFNIGVNGNLEGGVVIQNRWNETVDINRVELSRRIRTGKYIIRSDNFAGLTSDQVRVQAAVCGVPAGFKRESQQYRQTDDGLRVEYTIVDQEVFKFPPKTRMSNPIHHAEGEYIESLTNLGTQRWGQCRVRFEGAKYVPQGELIERAVAVAASKINLRHAIKNKSGNGFGILESGYISAGMYDNWVEVSLKCQMKPLRTGGTNGLVGQISAVPGVRYDQLAITPYSEPAADNPNGIPPPSLPRGSAGLFLQAAAFYDPNLKNWLMGGDGQLGSAGSPGKAPGEYGA